MPDSSWSKNESYNNYDPAESLQPELLIDPKLAEEMHREGMEGLPLPPTATVSEGLQPIYDGRRRKAAVVLTLIWISTITLHLVSWGFWVILGLIGLLGLQALRLLLGTPNPSMVTPTESVGMTPAREKMDWPFVSLLVAAKNEEVVIENLVKNMCSLDYPRDRYELWVVDDHSTDKTPLLLEKLTQEYPQLKVLRRSPHAGGGKSGALNQVMPLTQGEFVGVFDADAQVAPDLLKQVLPLFQREAVGGVQVRKAIANADTNFWTRGQEAEMALDTFFQQQRVAIQGMGELRGNGQFVRRTALESCGGWNEETITDDLDLTFRLHLNQWDIEVLAFPAVLEEGVTTPKALWHQRNRWAEGGYQRYLDYGPLLFSGRLGIGKILDLLEFWVIQYLIPTAAIPDCLMALVLRRPPITSPITIFTLTLSLIGMFIGLRRTRKETKFSLSTVLFTLLESLRGTFYMVHWFLVVGSTTTRISIRPKRLKWVKTVHHGSL